MKARHMLSNSLLLLAAITAACAQNNQPGGTKMQNINIARSAARQTSPGPAEYFTGTVQVETLLSVVEPSRMAGARVTFEPGARTAWHTHPLGQTLIVTAGTGWVQQEGAPVEEFNEGDVVRIPPGVRHWHGATPAVRMTHIALQEQQVGKILEWLEKVTDEQYRR